MANKIILFLITLSFVLLTFFSKSGEGCGLLTHIEIAFRATEHFNRTYRGLDIRAMMKKYPDALQAGAAYPDSYYNSLCEKGAFGEVSETTHWMEFMLPALDYFKQKYDSKPIDQDGEKLLTFLLGVMSHAVSDITWHSLGIDQGFIQAMRDINFLGNYGDAHSAADMGGDIVNRYELVYPSSTSLNLQWYVPTQDVVNIYKNMGIDLNEGTVTKCAVLMMKVAEAGEELALSKGYNIWAAKSPVLGASLNDYFNGGVNEMAAWVMQRWLTLFFYLENGGQDCTNSVHQPGNWNQHNPFYWACGNQPNIRPPTRSFSAEFQQNNSVHEHQIKMQAFEDLTKQMGETRPNFVENLFGSVISFFTPNNNRQTFLPSNNRNSRSKCSVNNYYLRKPYSTVGQAVLAADVNLDGFDDLIVGVPGYSFDNRFDEGRVFIVLGGQNGLPQSDFDLERADFVFPAPFTGSGRFGYSLAVLDFNNDGLPDIAVSAPIYAPDIVNAMYSGQVYVYFGQANGSRFNTGQPDIKIDCGKRYCNFGTTLSVGDVNRDGRNDLIIGSPYASQNLDWMKQNGFVLVYYSGTTQRPAVINALDNTADITLFGKDAFSWFGYSAITVSSECNLLIGAPATKHTSSDNTILQMSGSVYCYNLESRALHVFAEGTKNFENFGSSLAFGYPNGQNGEPVVAITSAHDGVDGHMAKLIPYSLTQAGTIAFYGLTPGSPQLGQLKGDRSFGRFGQPVKFVNFNNDGFDDLLIGAPLRPTHLTPVSIGGEAVGEMYIFNGKNDFVKDLIGRSCPILSTFSPCPGDQASKKFAIDENRAQFGSNAALIHVGSKTQVIVSATRSDGYSRQSGKLVLFSGDC